MKRTLLIHNGTIDSKYAAKLYLDHLVELHGINDDNKDDFFSHIGVVPFEDNMDNLEDKMVFFGCVPNKLFKTYLDIKNDPDTSPFSEVEVFLSEVTSVNWNAEYSLIAKLNHTKILSTTRLVADTFDLKISEYEDKYIDYIDSYVTGRYQFRSKVDKSEIEFFMEYFDFNEEISIQDLANLVKTESFEELISIGKISMSVKVQEVTRAINKEKICRLDSGVKLVFLNNIVSPGILKAIKFNDSVDLLVMYSFRNNMLEYRIYPPRKMNEDELNNFELEVREFFGFQNEDKLSTSELSKLIDFISTYKDL